MHRNLLDLDRLARTAINIISVARIAMTVLLLPQRVAGPQAIQRARRRPGQSG
jgi:hypothetical protein